MSTPSPAARPTNGAFRMCQRTRTRAGASKATKPQIIAEVESPAASVSDHASSLSSRTPTGAATSRPRRIAGYGSPRIPQASGTRAASADAVIPPHRARSSAAPPQLRLGSSGIRESSANCPPLRARTVCQSSSGSSANSSAGSGASMIHASSSISASSWPAPQPE